MGKKLKIKWLAEPAENNYPAAASYLGLFYDEKTVATYIAKLRKAPVTNFKSRDIFRASGLPLLGISNSQVEKNKKKIKSGEELSPILLIRDANNGKVIIADGYHRVCTVYAHDQEAFIPCKII